MSRSTRAIIDLPALCNNFLSLSEACGDKSIAVIKADAYGHGAVTVATALGDCCQYVAVAICDETIVLREAGIKQTIVVLEGPHDFQDCVDARDNNIILVVHSREQLEWLGRLPASQRPDVWLKVDSGMHRLGFAAKDINILFQEYAWLASCNCVLVSHYACADEPDNPFNEQQDSVLTKLKEEQGISLPVCMANSAAAVTQSGADSDWSRLGIGLYGASPIADVSAAEVGLKPVMTLVAQIIALHKVAAGESVGYSRTWIAQRDSVIATVGIGYADGYPRHCPSGTPVIVRGQRAQLVGRVSMDMITIDVTDIDAVALQDDVELWGSQLPVDEVARWANTISYELLTRVSARVPRFNRQ